MSEWRDRFLLFCGLLSLPGVTDAHQGDEATIDKRMIKKMIKEEKADQGHDPPPASTNLFRQGKQTQKSKNLSLHGTKE